MKSSRKCDSLVTRPLHLEFIVENLKFEPPGPGSWTLETVHFTRPFSLFASERFFDALTEGMRQSNAYYGNPLESLQFRSVNRFMYNQPRPVGAPEGAIGSPPKWLFRLIQYLHPAVRRRRERANWAFREKLWRQDVELWDTGVKPKALARAAELRAVDLEQLDDESLIAHLNDCSDFVYQTIVNHHRFNNCFALPVGDFLAQASGWSGLSAGELLRLFEGYSEVSRGSMKEMMALREALADDRETTALIRSDAPSEQIIEALRTRTDPVGRAVNAYMDRAGYCMLTGYDVADLMAIEMPDTMLRLIRSALDGGTQEGDLAGDKVTAEIRDRIPDQHKAAFDELLAEARFVYRIRDERGAMGDAMSTAIARRAVLEAGRRLADRNKIEDATELVDATLKEIAGLLRGGSTPTADEIHGRAHYRLTHSVEDAPLFLGAPASPPPPVDWFHKSGRRIQNASMTMFRMMFESSKSVSDEKVVRGLPIFPGTYEGRVCIVDGITDIEKIVEGDVMVARTTAPSFNVFLPLIGAVVTDRGGLLCHAAIVAREYGLPAVVGCGDATERLSDGMTVRVDGEKGEVWILDGKI